MQNVHRNTIKVNRALKLCDIGAHQVSAAAMLDAIPDAIIEALPARMIAQLIDANWALAQDAKAIAVRDAIEDGAVWDGHKMREIAA